MSPIINTFQQRRNPRIYRLFSRKGFTQEAASLALQRSSQDLACAVSFLLANPTTSGDTAADTVVDMTGVVDHHNPSQSVNGEEDDADLMAAIALSLASSKNEVLKVSSSRKAVPPPPPPPGVLDMGKGASDLDKGSFDLEKAGMMEDAAAMRAGANQMREAARTMRATKQVGANHDTGDDTKIETKAIVRPTPQPISKPVINRTTKQSAPQVKAREAAVSRLTGIPQTSKSKPVNHILKLPKPLLQHSTSTILQRTTLRLSNNSKAITSLHGSLSKILSLPNEKKYHLVDSSR